MKSRILLIVCIFISIVSVGLSSDFNPSPTVENDAVIFYKHTQPFIYKDFSSDIVSQLPANCVLNAVGNNYDTNRWKYLLDSIWGDGPSTEIKLKMFDHYWDSLNTGYASFVNLDLIDWDSLAYSIRSEIASGVSRGRFLGLMTHLIYNLNDAHTNFYDYYIRNSGVSFGLPVVSSYAKNKFPAVLTALDDTTALVLSAIKGNVFNLERGDVILGYNGKPLGYLINEIIDQKLPLMITLGSTKSATLHNISIAVACSWNLFDTLDVLKSDGSLEHISCKLMSGKNYWNDGYEIMPIEGLKFPSLTEVYNGDPISSCVLKGTDIGYIAFFSCLDRSGDSLYNHVKNLVEKHQVKGIVIDLRLNLGGVFSAFSKTMQYLEKKNFINWFNCADRANDYDRLAMKVDPYYANGYNIYDNDPHFYDGKVALLTGPNAMSAGDVMPVAFKQMDNVKLFGKPTAGAFGACTQVSNDIDKDYLAIMQVGNFILVNEPDKFLSHLEYPVDEEVWFTKESVVEGRDLVLESAINWINSTTDVNENSISSMAGEIFISPNPAKEFIKINTTDTNISSDLTIYSVYGAMVKKVRFSEKIDISDLNSGFYYIKIGNEFIKFIKI